MKAALESYGQKARVPAHVSFFRRRLAARARPAAAGQDPVHEYLIDQANLRGYLGAFSDRDDLGALDPELSREEILVGLLQPHAPADLRAVKLVVRMLQAPDLDVPRLVLLAKRERALENLGWVVSLVPQPELIGSLRPLKQRLEATPPRDPRRPQINYSPDRLLRRRRP